VTLCGRSLTPAIPTVQEDAAAEGQEEGQEEEALPEDCRFLPATAFTGTKDGYHFTTGAQGTGYYSIHGPDPAAVKCSKPAADDNNAAGTPHPVKQES